MPRGGAVVAAELERAHRNEVEILNAPVKRFHPLAGVTQFLEKMVLVSRYYERLTHDDVALLAETDRGVDHPRESGDLILDLFDHRIGILLGDVRGPHIH